MTALQERNALVAEARRLGIEKPHTLKSADLQDKINLEKAVRLTERAKREAEGDPFDDIDPSVEGDHHTPEEPAQEAPQGTREGWLLKAVELLIPLLEQAGATQLRTRNIAVSVGFPSKTIRKRIGECWADRASENGGVNHMFIHPQLDDPVQVLGVLAHELIHADDNGESNHYGHFKNVARSLGLTGKLTETNVGPDLEPVLKDIATELGPYPHVRLNLGSVKKQTTRLKKVACPKCDYTIRVTDKWIDKGLPTCPCGTKMEVAD